MIIEFNGHISEESKAYIYKQVDKGYRWGVLIFPIMFLLVCLPFFATKYVEWGIGVTVGMFLVTLLVSFCPKLHYKAKDLEGFMPISVRIEDDEIITDSVGKKDYSIRKITEIKEIVEYETCYYIKYYYPFYRYTLCQKDLITKGTLEEFEKLFEDKIVRKTK